MGKTKQINKIALEEQLIMLVQGHSFLYDLSSSSYKNENMKQQKWTEFAEILGITGKLKSNVRTFDN